MNKNYVFSLFAFSFVALTQQLAAQVCLQDSLHMYNAGPFNPYIAQRNYFQYDYAAQGYMDSKTEIVQNRSTENDPFVNFMRYDVSFNYREKESHRLTRNWVNGAWQNMNQVSFVYPNVYGDSVCTAEVVQLWDVGTGSWVNSGNTAYSYNNFDYP